MSVNGLEITDINIFPVSNPKPGSNLKGFCKIVLNEGLVITSIRLVHGSNGLFLGFPSNWNKDEQKNYDIVFPITAELREYISNEVIGHYNTTMANA
jgi:stage V sporulation protein G